MFSIKYKIDGHWRVANFDQPPNKGKKCHFDKRKKARNWIRNRRFRLGTQVMIIGPDGSQEKYQDGD